MQKYKKVIVFIISFAIFYMVGKFVGHKAFDALPKEKTIDVTVIEKDSDGRSILQTRKSDPKCTQNPKDLSEDTAFENVYYGEIKKGKPVEITLSCDQLKFTITGAVNQVIDSNNKQDIPEDDFTLVDISSGSQVVYVDDDYNFDGYNDIYAISSNGQGWDAVDSANIFLYNPTLNKFVYNPELSKLQNMTANPETKQIIENFSYHEGEKEISQYVVYKWLDGHLVKVK